MVNKGFVIWPKRELLSTGLTQEILTGQDEPILKYLLNYCLECCVKHLEQDQIGAIKF